MGIKTSAERTCGRNMSGRTQIAMPKLIVLQYLTHSRSVYSWGCFFRRVWSSFLISTSCPLSDGS